MIAGAVMMIVLAAGGGSQARADAGGSSTVVPCTARPLDFHSLRAASHFESGTLTATDQVVVRRFRTSDQRNFVIEVGPVDLARTGATLGETYTSTGRLIFVASYGSFQVFSDLVTRQPNPPPDLAVTILDANTGALFGEIVINPGCHND
jgi:hypothetical protein